MLSIGHRSVCRTLVVSNLSIIRTLSYQRQSEWHRFDWFATRCSRATRTNNDHSALLFKGGLLAQVSTRMLWMKGGLTSNIIMGHIHSTSKSVTQQEWRLLDQCVWHLFIAGRTSRSLGVFYSFEDFAYHCQTSKRGSLIYIDLINVSWGIGTITIWRNWVIEKTKLFYMKNNIVIICFK